MIDELIKPAPAPDKKLQPPARWRNWFIVKPGFTVTIRCTKCGASDRFTTGQIIDLCNCAPSYPSQEVAEIAANRDMSGDGGLALQYLGAYREGERP